MTSVLRPRVVVGVGSGDLNGELGRALLHVY